MEAKPFSRFRIDILLVSPSVEILKRVVQITERFKLTYFRVSVLAEYQAAYVDIGRPNLILMDVSDFPNKEQVDARVAEIRNFLPKCEILCIVSQATHKEYVKKLKDRGANEALSLEQVLHSTRLEFFIYHKFLLAYYPFEPRDIFPNTEVNFTAHHFLKLNNKYLPIVFKNFALSDKKFKKIEKLGKLFIKIDEAGQYKTYIENFYDTFNVGLWRRIKASYMKFIGTCRDFYHLMAFSGEENADEKIEAIVEEGTRSLHEFIKYIDTAKDPLFFFYQTYGENPVLQFDRTSLILGMAGLVAAKSGLADPANVLRVGLFTYVGAAALSHVNYLKWMTSSDESWTEEERQEFVKFLDLSRELAMERLKKYKDKSQIVAPLFERFDGKGLPGKLKGNDIRPETAILQFVERWMNRFLEKGKINSEELNESFVSCLAQDKASGRINPEFIDKIHQVEFLKVAA